MPLVVAVHTNIKGTYNICSNSNYMGGVSGIRIQSNVFDSLDTTHYRNWFNPNIKRSHEKKIIHIKRILSRQQKKAKTTSISDVLKLIYKLRTRCILRYYFDTDNIFTYLLTEDLSKHPGWKSFKTPEEDSILCGMKSALDRLNINRFDVRPFVAVDHKFGLYRHNQWLSTLGSDS